MVADFLYQLVTPHFISPYHSDWIPYSASFPAPRARDDDWWTGLWINLHKHHSPKEWSEQQSIESIPSFWVFLPFFVLVFPYYRSNEPFGKELVWYVFLTAERIGWENSRHFATPPLVSPRNDVWETSTEIPYWWPITTLIWVVLLIGWRKFPSLHDQSEALTRSGKWSVISMELLCSFLRHNFAGKPAVASGNFGCFLRLLKSRLL